METCLGRNATFPPRVRRSLSQPSLFTRGRHCRRPGQLRCGPNHGSGSPNEPFRRSTHEPCARPGTSSMGYGRKEELCSTQALRHGASRCRLVELSTFAPMAEKVSIPIMPLHCPPFQGWRRNQPSGLDTGTLHNHSNTPSDVGLIAESSCQPTDSLHRPALNLVRILILGLNPLPSGHLPSR